MDIIDSLLFILIITLTVLILKHIFRGEFVKSNSGISYRVDSDESTDQVYSSNTLDKLRNRSIKISNDLNDERLKNVLMKAQFEELYGGNPNILASCVEKGEIMKFRLYYSNGDKIPMSSLDDTLIHELSHIRSITYGHNSEFDKNHNELKMKFNN